jgi:hypothetical protein
VSKERVATNAELSCERSDMSEWSKHPTTARQFEGLSASPRSKGERPAHHEIAKRAAEEKPTEEAMSIGDHTNDGESNRGDACDEGEPNERS